MQNLKLQQENLGRGLVSSTGGSQAESALVWLCATGCYPGCRFGQGSLAFCLLRSPGLDCGAGSFLGSGGNGQGSGLWPFLHHLCHWHYKHFLFFILRSSQLHRVVLLLLNAMLFFLLKSDTSCVCDFVAVSMPTLQQSCQRLIFLTRWVRVNSRSMQIQLFIYLWCRLKQV